MELDEILWIVKRYLERLSRDIAIEECYVFGSTARGDRLKSSDVDIVIVSPSVEGLGIDERIRLAYRAWGNELPADIFVLTPSEFQYLRERSVVLRDASKYWIRVA